MAKSELKGLIDFLHQSKSTFHAVKNLVDILEANGFARLGENEDWKVSPGGSYYVTRDDSSVLAFRMPQEDFDGFQIVASHSDSPCFKVKEIPELEQDKKYTQLNVEGYGGMISGAWLDRPLSIAGRVVIDDGKSVRTKLIDIDEDLVLIPHQAIHMERTINEGHNYNIQKDLLPLLGDVSAKGAFDKIIAKAAGVASDKIVGRDIFLYNRMPPSIWGANKEYFSAQKIDNLECAYTTLNGFMQAKNIKNVAVYCCFDNEEVGSGTKQGANSTFLYDCLNRIMLAIDKPSEYFKYLANSFMVSADNAHAHHPNFPEKSDKTNHVLMNEGIVIKHSANQKYSTDAVSQGVFKAILKKVGVPIQHYTNRSDITGGSTLGNISDTQVSINTVDIGLSQLAMHSPYETAGTKDVAYMEAGIKAFMEAHIKMIAPGSYEI